MPFYSSRQTFLTNVIEIERSCSRFLENSIVTSFLFVYCVHIVSCCVCLRCVFVIYHFHTHGDIVVGLLIISSMLKDGTLFSFSSQYTRLLTATEMAMITSYTISTVNAIPPCTNKIKKTIKNKGSDYAFISPDIKSALNPYIWLFMIIF